MTEKQRTANRVAHPASKIQQGEALTPPYVCDFISSLQIIHRIVFRSHIRRFNRSMWRIRVIIKQRFITTAFESTHDVGSCKNKALLSPLLFCFYRNSEGFARFQSVQIQYHKRLRSHPSSNTLPYILEKQINTRTKLTYCTYICTILVQQILTDYVNSNDKWFQKRY